MKPAAVLDIGSSKIICLCGSFANRDGITVHGVSVCPYPGFSDGVFSDHRALRAAVTEAVQQAEQQARIRIREVGVSVPGPFTRLVVSQAAVPSTGKGRRVSAEDIDRVISLSLGKADAPDWILMHSTPVSFTVNGQVTGETPLGKKADEFSALVSHMYVQEEFLRTMEQALSPMDVEISMNVSSQLCGALAIIPERERIRPAVLIDVGYAHTDVSVVENAAITDTRTVNLGGRHFAGDLSFGLDIPPEAAEQVKRRYVFLQEPLSHTEIVRTPAGIKRVDHGVIELIMEARAGELVTLIRQALREMGISAEANPITYVTGGGFAMMKNGYDYLKANLQLPVKRDAPWAQDMDTPNYTSAFAALDFVLRAIGDDVIEPQSQGGVVERLRDLFTK